MSSVPLNGFWTASPADQSGPASGMASRDRAHPKSRDGRLITMRRFRFFRAVIAIAVVGALPSALGAQSSQSQVAADAQLFIKALDIRPGSVVAEIGAGDGALTVELARRVGDQGRVFSNELNATKAKAIAALAEQRSLSNVTTIEGRVTESGLPVQCCDVIVMRDVYHHFSDPAAMNQNLLASLKPGGKIGILEF